MMLRYSFGEHNAALAIENAVRNAVTSGKRTLDIAFGRESTTTKEMGNAILDAL